MLNVESTTMEEVLIEMVRELDTEDQRVLSQIGRHSRNKGKRGEREVAKIFRDAGYPARRSVQYNGRPGTVADVVGVPSLHIEVKFVEKVCSCLEQTGGEERQDIAGAGDTDCSTSKEQRTLACHDEPGRFYQAFGNR